MENIDFKKCIKYFRIINEVSEIYKYQCELKKQNCNIIMLTIPRKFHIFISRFTIFNYEFENFNFTSNTIKLNKFTI